MAEPVTVRPVTAADRVAWDALWDRYLAFYETERGQTVKDATWARILDPAQPMQALLAIDATGTAVGLANYLFHLTFWETSDVCYLNDLFVDPDLRGQGAGRALVAAVEAAARARGCSELYWLTGQDNARARRLYDQVATCTPFAHYTQDL